MQNPDIDYGRPGKLLQSLFHSLSPDVFQEVVLDRYLVRALNSLPSTHRNELSHLLCKAFDDTRMIRKLHFYESSEVLDTLINDLEVDCTANPGGNAAQRQGQHMKEIVEAIKEWLPDLWQVGVEAGAEIRRVHESLMHCMEVCNRASAVRSRALWTDYSKGPLSIGGSNDAVLFHEQRVPVKRGILWVWRDLLICATAAGLHPQVNIMIEDLRRSGWLADVRKMIPRGNETHDSHNCSFHRSHWNPRIFATASELRPRLV